MLGIFLAAQFSVAAIVAVVGMSIAQVQGKNVLDPQQVSEVQESVMAPAVVLGLFFAGVAILLASPPLIGAQLRDRTPVGAAWVPGSSKDIAQGAGIGMLIAALYITVAIICERLGVHGETGPIAKMAVSHGAPRIAWLVAALILAPPFEELLFRGILYGGYRRSFSPVLSAVLTTFIFCFLHVTEFIHFLPGLLGITGLALGALWIRLRAAAIGPAVAMHFGYNAVVALTLLLSD